MAFDLQTGALVQNGVQLPSVVQVHSLEVLEDSVLSWASRATAVARATHHFYLVWTQQLRYCILEVGWYSCAASRVFHKGSLEASVNARQTQ